jgi:Asp-tRNA(Asn)/Glu-tRNA(Gln) amidotransferase A subunit family amidase
MSDLYDIQGTKTSMGCRAFGMLRGDSPRSAKAVRQLQQIGLILVGKTKTSQ